MHNKYAPYWALGLAALLLVGLSSIWIDLGKFWKGYVLDICGPAWSYILFRGLFTEYSDNAWRRFFTPDRTLAIFIAVCYGIEAMQYFELYDSTFDYFDLLAYISILVPLYLIDKRIISKDNYEKTAYTNRKRSSASHR